MDCLQGWFLFLFLESMYYKEKKGASSTPDKGAEDPTQTV
jgi:hypothetical protein